jgi:hypothetical protein
MKNTYLLTVFNATFNNISVISRRSVLLVEETGWPGEKPQVTDKHYHIMLYTSPWAGVKPTKSVVIGTDCIGRCKSNYSTITATTALFTLYMYLSAEFYTLIPVLCTYKSTYHINRHMSILWKESFNSVGQQIQLYKQDEQLPLISNKWTQRRL